MVKNPTAKQEMQVQSLGWEDPLEKELATHSSILGWDIPQTEEPGRLQSMGLQRAGHDLVTILHHQSVSKMVVIYLNSFLKQLLLINKIK